MRSRIISQRSNVCFSELVANVNMGENKLDSYIAKMTDDDKYVQV